MHSPVIHEGIGEEAREDAERADREDIDIHYMAPGVENCRTQRQRHGHALADICAGETHTHSLS